MSAQVTFDVIGGQNDSSWSGGKGWQNFRDGGMWQANPGDSWLLFEAKQSGQSTTTYIQGYTITLTSESNSEGRLPYTWTLYGSNDEGNDKEWTLIHSQQEANRMKEDFLNVNVNINNKKYVYYCNSATQYKYFKFKVTGKAEGLGTWGCFQISGFDLIPSTVGFSPSASSDGMDGNTSTTLSGTTFPQTITVNGSTSRITGFQFTTGNNVNNNNPKTIKVSGSNDGTNWTTIEMKTGYTGMANKNYYPYVFQCYGTETYSKYQFSFNDVPSGTFKMSELAIITESGCSHPEYSADGFCEKCLSPQTPGQDVSNNYLINNAGKFVSFAKMVNIGTASSANAKLTANIDLTNVSWTPIGTSTNKYTGTFDGQSNKVTLNMTNTEGTYQGLFGRLANGANISNIIVAGTVKGANQVAGIAGGSNGEGTIHFANCCNEANVTTSGQNAAAIIAESSDNPQLYIRNCVNAGDIKSNHQYPYVGAVGAWIGTNNTSVIENFINVGKIEGYNGSNRIGRFWGSTQNVLDAGTGVQPSNNYYCSKDATSGELTYYANEQAGETVFYQSINSDNYPVPFNTSDVVYYVGEAGYTTFYDADNDWELVGDANVYIGSLTSNGAALHLDEIDDIPAGTAVVIGGTYYNKISTDASSATTGNILLGSNGNVTGGDGIYALAKKNDEVGFYPVKNTVTIPAGKAYLNTNAGVRGFTFVFDEDDATAIENVNVNGNVNDNNAAIYNLAGQRLNKVQKGINIINGRKVLF